MFRDDAVVASVAGWWQDNNLIQNENFLPSQFGDINRAGDHARPNAEERRLVLAIMETALLDWHRIQGNGWKYRGTRDALANELTGWFNSDDDYPGSFVWCCDALGIKHTILRTQLDVQHDGCRHRGPVIMRIGGRSCPGCSVKRKYKRSRSSYVPRESRGIKRRWT